MVDLVLQGARKDTAGPQRHRLSVSVQSLHDDAFRTGDLPLDAGHAQAPFHAHHHLAFPPDDLRVDERDRNAGFVGGGNVDHDDAPADAHLGRRQPDAFGLVHGIEHISDKFPVPVHPLS